MTRLVRSLMSIAGPALAAVLATPRALPAQGTGEAWQLIAPPQSSLVFAREGGLIGEIGTEWRTSVALASLPLYVGQAFVAVEDQRFYLHDGVDLVGIAGALKDAVAGHPRGASTITQQLVGNMHPDLVDRRDKSIGRKLREQQAAREMEKHYTKAQILEGYLNQIHFGHGWYGVDAASRHYFGHGATQLSLVEAATLAALPKGPAIYDPIHHPDSARVRRNLVLALMAQQGFVTAEQAHAAQREPVMVAPDRGMPAAAPYVVDLVRRELEHAHIPVAAGGLRITTTVDARLQRAANLALAAGAARIEARPGWKHPTLAHHVKGTTGYLQGLVVAIAPATGDLLALVGGRDYAESPFDRATYGLRQPGSAFKPFVYAAALGGGLQANAPVADSAISIPMPHGPPYAPENSDGKYLGALTLRDALVHSRNTVAVQLGQRVGIDSVAALAARLGITTPISPGPASAIGASEVRPIELVAAYSAFETGGVVHAPRLVMRVQDAAGRILLEPAPSPPDSALDPRVAFVMRDLMRDVVARGTATAVRDDVPPEIPVAGKTGTTNDNSDVWFVGMTPEIVAGVWLGFDKPTSIARGAAGGTLAAPVWGEMIGGYYKGRATDAAAWDATLPRGVIPVLLDRTTGASADSTTPPARIHLEFLIVTLAPEPPASEPRADTVTVPAAPPLSPPDSVARPPWR